MPSIQQFNDFMQSAPPTYLTGPERLVNEAVKHNYMWGSLIKGHAKSIQGGESIKDVIMLDDARTFQMYQPNDTFTYSNPQVQTTLSANWRFALDHMAWTDHEIELNTADGLTRDALRGKWKDLKHTKEQRLATSFLNGIEETLFRAPSYDEMVPAGGMVPYSIPVFVHDYVKANGGSAPMAAEPFNWTGTEVVGIDTATESRWRNAVGFYDPAADVNAAAVSADYGGGSGADPIQAAVDVRGLFPAFDDMWMRLGYRPPQMMSEYFENYTIRRQMIVTSRAGMNQYRQALRASNDNLVAPQDPSYSTPTYSGIPLRYSSELDTAACYPAPTGGAPTQSISAVLNATTATFATEDEATCAGPRYYFLNAEYLTPFIHRRRYFHRKKPVQHPQQPFTHIMVVDCWWNLLANSRQRHGIVAPAPST